MKKILKWTGLAVLTLLLLLAALLIWNAHRQLLSDDYPAKIRTGGAVEEKYAGYGPEDVAYFEQTVPENYEKYEIWYPAALPESQRRYPVIVINNGTGMRASRQQAAYCRLASWGFIVVANEEEYSWNGFAAEMSLRFLLRADGEEESIFHQHVDTENIGVTGHSQGGVACINTVTKTEHAACYRAAFLVSPTAEELADALEWEYDISDVRVPVAILAGTGKVDAETIIPLAGLRRMYGHASASSFVLMARKSGYDHGETAMQTDGYMTAWFRYWLQGDEEAGRAFVGETAEIMENALYQDVQRRVTEP